MPDHIYYTPELVPLAPGTVVYHKHVPGIAFTVASGLMPGVLGPKYLLRWPGGKEETAYRHNLIIKGG
jgi:hypothetical protein